MKVSGRIFRKADPLPGRRHLLLIGAPRSGTTLLATMIGRHTEVGMLNEDVTGRGLRKVLGRRVTGNKLCIPNQIQLQTRASRVVRCLKRLGIVAEAPKSEYSIEDYLELSNLKIIAIIRDGNDTISSMMKRGHSSWKKAARRWSRAVKTITNVKWRYPERVLVVAFEDLVVNPRRVMSAICAFLGLCFEEEMLEGYRLNPWYKESQLNQEKVSRYRQENIDFQLELKLPAAYHQYQSLLADAQKIYPA